MRSSGVLCGQLMEKLPRTLVLASPLAKSATHSLFPTSERFVLSFLREGSGPVLMSSPARSARRDLPNPGWENQAQNTMQ